MGFDRNRFVLTLVLAALAGCVAPAGANALLPETPLPDEADPGPTELILTDCFLALGFFGEPAAQGRLARFVPEPFRPAARWTPPRLGSVPLAEHVAAVWHVTCADALVGDLRLGEVQVVLGSIAIEHMEDDLNVAGFLVDTHWYPVWAHTDNAEVAARFNGAGWPVTLVERPTFERVENTLTRDVTTEVVTGEGAYGMRLSAPEQDPPHWHGNAWWQAPEGTPVPLRFTIANGEAVDKSCHVDALAVLACTVLTAEAGTSFADFLGAEERRAAGADHDLIHQIVVTAG